MDNDVVLKIKEDIIDVVTNSKDAVELKHKLMAMFLSIGYITGDEGIIEVVSSILTPNVK